MKKIALIFTSLFSIGLLSSVSAPQVLAQTATVSGDPACVRSGCNNELCVRFGSGMNTSCVYRPEFACYQQATCEMNTQGNCAFTITSQVQACLDNTLASPTPSPSASPQVSPSPEVSPSPAVSPSPTVLVGDLNNDGKVNLIDYSIMVNDLFKTGPNLEADINQDGKVNLLDYSILVTNLST